MFKSDFCTDHTHRYFAGNGNLISVSSCTVSMYFREGMSAMQTGS